MRKRLPFLLVAGLALAAEPGQGVPARSMTLKPAAPVITSTIAMLDLGSLIISVGGRNLREATQVTIGDQVATFRIVGDQIVAAVNSDSVTGPVAVTTPAGKAVSGDQVERGGFSWDKYDFQP